MLTEILMSVAPLQRDLLIRLALVFFLLCPLMILVGAALPPRRGWPYRWAALLALILATASLFFVLPCPELADLAGVGTSDSASAQSICRDLVVETRIIFIGLTLIYGAVILLPDLLRLRDNRLFSTVLPLSFLILYAAGAVFLVQTTHSAAAITSSFQGTAITTAGAVGTQPPELERK